MSSFKSRKGVAVGVLNLLRNLVADCSSQLGDRLRQKLMQVIVLLSQQSCCFGVGELP